MAKGLPEAMRKRRPPCRKVSLSGTSGAGRRALALVATAWLALATGLLLSACWLPPETGNGSGADEVFSPPFAQLYDTPAAEEWPGEFVVYFLDVGQGDAIFLRTPDGRVVLVDAGEDPGQVAAFLSHKKVARVDVLLLTHPHADHVGGALEILRGYEVGTLLNSGYDLATPVYEAVLAEALALKGAGKLAYAEPRAGETLEWDPSLGVTVLHPGSTLGQEANEASVVVRVTFGSFAVLLTGDAGAADEETILGLPLETGATVLKVAHHGSSGSSSPAFLAAVRPAVAVIQVGPNSYGHPSRQTLERLETVGARVYRTDRDGTVIVHSDGEAWAAIVGP